MSQIHGDDVPYHNGTDCGAPREARPYKAKIWPVASSTEEIPPHSKRIREQGDDELPLDEEDGKVVRHVVCQRNGHQSIDKSPRQGGPRQAPLADTGHDPAKATIYTEEQERQGHQP